MDFYFVGKLFILLVAFADFSNADNEYDILLFIQQWPITACLQHEKNLKECYFCNNAFWNIHGIWPTKNYPGKSPENCDLYHPFNERHLLSIKKELSCKWYNVFDKKIENFWSWEWQKHGTCAMDLPAMNSQYKYFQQGLLWSKHYVIGNILMSKNIIKGKSYSYKAIQAALTSGLKVTPQVMCHKDKSGKKQFLHEVRICIDKKLQLIDCHGHVSETNCNLAIDIEYPSV
ncbi:ribonuclease Oy-like [Leptopilina heterotoma]|uniref:ribonuclease Oy-like n=1 Tax=Leptopilina heterotoma TaxID=63436 RepID=UPI001CA9632C|nr:ribonuclease Oy-like [Leptopilina heterotoma]